MTATASPPPRRAGTRQHGDSLQTVIEPALAAAATRGPSTLASVTLPVPPMDPLALFQAAQARAAEAALWLQPTAGLAFIGLGSAWSVRAEGEGRFAAVDEAWSLLCSDAVQWSDPAAAPRGSGPIVTGGLGFGDEAATDPTWAGFETAVFTLPSFLITVTAEGTWLTMNHVVAVGDEVAMIALQAATAWHRLASAASADLPDGAKVAGLRLVARHPEAGAWRDAVARLAGAVGRGRIDKAVLARSVELAAPDTIDVPGVLARLRRSAPESTIFAFGRAGRTFLGATPERLLSLEGRELRTMAMAGSAPRTGDSARDAQLALELLGSDKEREEHEVVVATMRETLAPLAQRLAIAPVPRVEAFRHVQHLVTPIEVTLRGPARLLDLAGRLHPTPAVGGTPREVALELAAEEESSQRGWYAGPVGWVDARGDGELMVALRSGVVDGARATLFAGCGIMADSDPEREWEESETKLRALWGALDGTSA
jgi:isochorismate synthase